MEGTAEELIRLDGRHAVVTGAARGIGRAITERFAHAGASVLMADRLEEVHDVAAKFQADGLDVSSVVMDVTNAQSHDELVATAVAAKGRLDIWVNNAGIYPVHMAVEMTDADWLDVLDTNTNGTFYGCRAAGRHMTTAGKGVIINLASVSGFRVSGDGRAHYAASKGAVRSLTQAFAREISPYGVRVVALAPTATMTDGVLAQAAALSAARGTTDQEADYSAALPIRRVAQPDDIARVALFCASDLAGMVTGTTIAVDGGQMAV